MHISIAYIPAERAEAAREKAACLAKAVNTGAMRTVDKEGAALRAMATDETLVSDEAWQGFLTKLRRTQGSFAAPYLLDSAAQEAMLRTEPVSGEEEALLGIVKKAHQKGGLVLELPLLEDDDD